MIETQNREIYFMNRMFNHDFYDSLVSSGKINFVDRSIQQPLQNVFHYIRDHNAYLQKIRNIEDEGGDDIPRRVVRYYEMLEIIEIGLPDAIKEMLKKLGV